MEHLIVPAGYEPAIDLRETQIAIKIIKDFFRGSWQSSCILPGCRPLCSFCPNRD